VYVALLYAALDCWETLLTGCDHTESLQIGTTSFSQNFTDALVLSTIIWVVLYSTLFGVAGSAGRQWNRIWQWAVGLEWPEDTGVDVQAKPSWYNTFNSSQATGQTRGHGLVPGTGARSGSGSCKPCVPTVIVNWFCLIGQAYLI